MKTCLVAAVLGILLFMFAFSEPGHAAASEIDLKIGYLSLSLSFCRPGDSIKVNIDIKNSGYNASGEFSTRIILTKEENGSRPFVAVLDTFNTESISGTSGKLVNRVVSIPPDTQYNKKYIVSVKVDSSDSIPEINEDNNIKEADLRVIPDIDLRVGTIMLNTSSVFAGQSVTVTCDIANLGTDPSGDFTTAIFGEVGDTLCQFAVNSIPGNSDKIINQTITIPSQITEGLHWICVLANSDNSIEETETGGGFVNNVQKAELRVFTPSLAANPTGVLPYTPKIFSVAPAATLVPHVVLSLDPASTVIIPGSSFSVSVIADTAGNDISSGDIEISFDKDALEITDITPGNVFADNPLVPEKNIDNAKGIGRLAAARGGGSDLPGESVCLLIIEGKVKPQASPGKEYKISISKAGLANGQGQDIQVNLAENAVITINPIQQKVGDLNSDGKIDYRDLGMFGRAYRTSNGQNNFNDSADLNSDKVIDYLDLAIFGSRYGKTAPQATTAAQAESSSSVSGTGSVSLAPQPQVSSPPGTQPGIEPMTQDNPEDEYDPFWMDVPKYPNATFKTKNVDSPFYGGTPTSEFRIYTTTDSKSSVYQYFDQEMPKNGWRLETLSGMYGPYLKDKDSQNEYRVTVTVNVAQDSDVKTIEVKKQVYPK
ncbi:MAG: hypothetical protein JXA46_10500 [Dehalococcoidales bacterium]|nr:hypothetical protein [Dehalococcoidales bacterium]